MSSSKAHEQWVDDQLHSILGAAQRTIRMFVISKSRTAKSSSALASELQGLGFPNNDNTTTFAAQLLDRFATKKQPSVYEKQHREAVRTAALNARLNTLHEEDPPLPAAPTTDAAALSDREDQEHAPRKHKDKKPKSRKRDRRRRDDDADGEDDTAARLQQGRGKQRWELDEEEFDQEEDEDARRKREEDEAERAAREAEEEDQREREDFETRLRGRDVEERARRRGGKHVEEDHEALGDKLDLENKSALVSQLRLLSEQVYLEKRQEKELARLVESIEDEKRMFGNAPLTKQEREENEQREVILRLASAIKQSHEAQAEETYHLPRTYDRDAQGLSDRQKLLKARYKDDKPSDEGTPWGEQEELEQEMLRRTGARTAAAAAAVGVGGVQEQFDLVFEDQIDFVNLEAIAGDDLSSSEDEGEKESAAVAAAKLSERERIRVSREALPSFAYRQQFLEAVYKHQVLIIVAETGAGKTTQLPQYLLEEGFGKAGIIGCTQPRRVAAMSVAARVAEEMDVRLGREVGYSIRFEDNTSDKTVVKYMTDGMLLREFLTEPTLKEYSVMIIDEAHERTLHTDILFGLVKDIAKVRPDFKLLISSATLDAEKFSSYFSNAPIFSFPGRRYPVDILYTAQPEADYIEAAVVTVLQIHVTQDEGDVLVFLTGQEEIEACEELLKQRTRGFGSKIKDLEICPIYANLPTDLQAKIFEPTPPGCRKVVLATNIAETSLTIDGIKYVIDPGFHKINSFSPKTGMESLQVVPISQASANQRAGRAGRTSAGKCFRLYTQWSYLNDMEESTVPEIQRTNLASVALLLKSLGINNVVDFDFMDRPPTEALLKAFEQLYALGALNSGGDLTKLGRRMAEFPTDPQLAKTILAAEPLACTVEIATVAAMVSVGSAVFYAPKDKKVIADNARRNFYRGGAGDHCALLAVFTEWAETEFSSQWCLENYVQLRTMKRARDIREQLLGLMERVEISMETCGEDDTPVRKALTAGYFYNAAQLSKPTEAQYKTVKQRHSVFIHPGSGVKQTSEGMLPEYVVYHELVLTSKQYMRTVSEIDGAWLRELAPHFYSEKDVSDKNKKKVKGKGRSAAEPA